MTHERDYSEFVENHECATHVQPGQRVCPHYLCHRVLVNGRWVRRWEAVKPLLAELAQLQEANKVAEEVGRWIETHEKHIRAIPESAGARINATRALVAAYATYRAACDGGTP